MRTRTPEQDEVARLHRVLEMHLADERLLSWVGTSVPRMTAVMEAFSGGRVSLRRAIDIAASQKPEIPATSLGVVVDTADEDDEVDEPAGIGAGAPWDDE